jgi:hypothetical protein
LLACWAHCAYAQDSAAPPDANDKMLVKIMEVIRED